MIQRKKKFVSKKIADSAGSKELWKNIRIFGMVSFSRPSPTKTFSLDQLNDYFTSVSNQHVNVGNNDLLSILGNQLYFSRPVFCFSAVHLN